METKLVAISVEELQQLMQSTIRQEIEAALQTPVTGAGIQEELWDRKQAASFLGISEQTLVKLVLEGKIIAQRSGRKYHFLKSNILNFLRRKYQ
jgi:excisionase family DNA binding protein